MSKVPGELLKKITKTIRLPQNILDGLDDLARRYDTDRSTIQRWAAQALIDYVKAHKGRCTLPVNFDENWQKKKR